MSENNFESLNEQQIAELYGDVLEEPIQVASASGCEWYQVGCRFRAADDCARAADGFGDTLRCGGRIFN